jgi:hypothetical protein
MMPAAAIKLGEIAPQMPVTISIKAEASRANR